MRISRLLFLFLPVAACGGADDASAPDAGVPDATPAGDVFVQTYAGLSQDPGPVPGPLVGGIDVIGVDVDGATTTVTSVNGLATLHLHGGASVTAVYHALDGFPRLITRLDVQPGDTYKFGDAAGGGSGPTTGTMTVTYPAVPGTGAYDIVSACDARHPVSPATSDVISHSTTCDPATEDVLLFANTDNGGFYGVIPSMAFSDGGTAALDAWQPATTFSVSVDPPADAQSTHVDVQEVANGTDLFKRSAEVPTATFEWPPVGDGIVATALIGRADGEASTRVRLDPQTRSYAFTSDSFLSSADPGGTFDSATGTATFHFAPDPRVDATELMLSYARDGQPHEYAWHVIAPPGATSIVLPTLPAPYSDDAPLPTDTSLTDMVAQFDLDGVSGFDDTIAPWSFQWSDYDVPTAGAGFAFSYLLWR